MHNPSICMVALDVNSCVKELWYSECDLSNFQNFTYGRIHKSVTVIHLHAHLLHETRGKNIHPTSNNGIMKLIISNTVLFYDHTYCIFHLMINSSVSMQTLYLKSTCSSHQKFLCVMMSTQAIM